VLPDIKAQQGRAPFGERCVLVGRGLDGKFVAPVERKPSPAFPASALDQVYSLEPVPAKLDLEHQSHILGAQGNLWTEYVPSFKHAQYMIFPRLCALAEVAWSAKAARNYADFVRRLGAHLERLDQLGVNYRKGIPEN
jgi:hexosaminidase